MTVEELLKEGFIMSGKIEYLEQLVKAYEKIITKEDQDKIKNFIFSEDDR